MPKNLLLADDSITIQKVVGITFATEDYRITAVDNGDDALRKAREIRPDIIVADVVMPKRNGYELCEAVKGDPELARIPVLLLAGTFEAFDEGRAKAVRADGHISKPFDSQSLINRVKELVEGTAPAAAPPQAVAPAAPAPARPAAPGPQPARPPPGAMPGARPPGPGPGAPRPGAPGVPPGGARPPAPGMAPRPPGPMPPGAGGRPPSPMPARPGMPGPAMPAPRQPGPGGLPPGARPPPGRMVPPGARPPSPIPPGAARPVPPSPAARSAPSARPAAVPPPPAPVAPRPPPAAARPEVFDLGPPAPPSAPTPQPSLEDDWSDLGLGDEGPKAAAPRPFGAPALVEVKTSPTVPVAAPPSAAAAATTKTAPLALAALEEEEEIELAPASEFVPLPEETGHKPEPPAPVPAVPAPDGGEAQLRQALAQASREVIERIAWEVVPQLAETIIREHVDRLAKQRQGQS